MKIKFLKAGSGDSILIHHGTHNILIDGGNESKNLLEELYKVYLKNQVIDLLIITHHDDDHISGIIDLLKSILDNKFGIDHNFIKKVIFNSPNLVNGQISPKGETNLLSYQQAHEVEIYLNKLNIDWQIYTNESAPIIFSDLQLNFLAPFKEDIEKYSANKPSYLASDFRCDWESSFHILDKYIDDKSQDISIANQSSVVISVECESKKILLTGDITPNRLEKIVNNLFSSNNNEPVYYDYIKLPHHASYRSLNENILKKIKCLNYIISTNSRKHYLPNKRALLKVLKYVDRDKKEKINFFFNYKEALTNLNITEKEKRDYSFSVNPNNEDYGISF